MKILAEMRGEMQSAGFKQLQTVFFPQCLYPSGWWSATMASKADLLAFREQDAVNKSFETVYYNSDIHRASLAMPEFFKKAFA
jgi:spermidine synthase